MKKTYILILLLFLIILSSTYINYENFTTLFKIRFKSRNNYKMVKKFPKQNFNLDDYGRLCIQILNNTSNENRDDIIVWLDDLPFCDKWIQEDDMGNLKEEITRGVKENNDVLEKNCGFYTGNTDTNGNNWETYISNMEERYTTDTDKDKIPRFMIINSDGTIDWDSKKRKEYKNKPNLVKRYFKLKPLQVLRIIPPHKNQNKYHFEKRTGANMGFVPYMCMLQYTNVDIHGGDRGFSFGEYDNSNEAKRDNFGAYKNCGGAGIYITDNLDINISGENITTQSISRIEYNINNGEIYFNFSAVDGSNINYDANYDLSEGNNGSDNISASNLNNFCGITEIKCDTTKISEIENLNNDNIYKNLDEYLYYTNGNPYIKSIPSIKAFSHKCGNLYYKQTTMNLNSCPLDDSEDPDSEYKCISPITFSSSTKGNGNNFSNEWTYWEKAIYNIKVYKKNLTKDDTNLYEFEGSNINSYNISNQINGVIGQNIQECIKNLKFDLSKIPDTALSVDQSIINDKNCADAPYGYGLNKAICHIWWGLTANKCAKDYTDIIRNIKQDGTMGCTQYTWAYGEMGYDLANNQLKNILDRTEVNDKSLYFSDDGNPQKYPYCQTSPTRCNFSSSIGENTDLCNSACDGKMKNDIPKNNNLESPNKPLLNCQIPNSSLDSNFMYKNLKENPVNINISINFIQRGKITLKEEDLNNCIKDNNDNDCRTMTQTLEKGNCTIPDKLNKTDCENNQGTWTSLEPETINLNCLMAGINREGNYTEKVCTPVTKDDCLKGLLDPKPSNKIWCGTI